MCEGADTRLRRSSPAHGLNLRLYHPRQAAAATTYVEQSLLAIRDHTIRGGISRAARTRKRSVDQRGSLDLRGNLDVDSSYAAGADAVRHLVRRRSRSMFKDSIAPATDATHSRALVSHPILLRTKCGEKGSRDSRSMTLWQFNEHSRRDSPPTQSPSPQPPPPASSPSRTDRRRAAR